MIKNKVRLVQSGPSSLLQWSEPWRPSSRPWALSQLPSAATNLSLFPSWRSHMLPRGRDHLISSLHLPCCPGPGVQLISRHTQWMCVSMDQPASYAITCLLSARRGKFTSCYFTKNIPLRGISFPKLEEHWKKSSTWYFSTLNMSVWM